MRDHNKLRAFELADELAIMIYRVTKAFPREEVFGLTAQTRRAAVSVPSNIVEGCARESQADYLRFLEIAFGSLRELHHQCDLEHRLGCVRDARSDLVSKFDETEKVLAALLRSMRKPRSPDSLQPTASRTSASPPSA